MSYARLLGKRVLVTGGGSGIGRSICKIFAREGAEVAIMDINGKGTEQTLELIKDKNSSKRHCVIEGDVGNVDDIKRSFETAYQAFGQKPNVLVNNAAIVRGGLIDTVADETVAEILNTNLKAVYLMSKYFIADVKDSGEQVNGTIVNVSSVGGKRGIALNSDYVAAKAGLLGLTKSIALEFRWHKVRCNALLPGTTDTPILATVDKELLQNMHDAIPMGRYAQPDEIAYGCLFLASDESSYVHGTCLDVAGGF